MNKFEMELKENATKAFFFKHVEKLLVGLGAVLLGVFVYLSFGLTPKTTDEPSALRSKVQNAERRIQKGVWDSPEEPSEGMAFHRKVVNDAVGQFKKNRSAVPPNTFALESFTARRRNSTATRTDPMVASPMEPVVNAVRVSTIVKHEDPDSAQPLMRVPTTSQESVAVNTKAMVAMPGIDASDAGIEKDTRKFRTKASYFLSVRYLLPYRKMTDDFIAKLASSNSYNAELDKPIVGYLQIERKEGDGPWTDVSEQIKDQNKKFVTNSPDFVGDDAYDRMLTLPVPPVLGEDYVHFSSHPKVAMKEYENKDSKNGVSSVQTAGSNKNGEEADDEHQELEPEFKLVRFVDSDVSPGKSYQYRLRVWYFDSNNPRPKPVKESEKKTGRSRGASSKEGGAPSLEGGGGGGNQNKGIDSEEELIALETKVTQNQVSESVRKRLRDQLKLKRPKEYLTWFRPSAWSTATKQVEVPVIRGEVVLAKATPQSFWKFVDQVGGKSREIVGPRRELTIEAVAAQWDDKFGVRVPVMVEKIAVGTLVVGSGHATVWDPLAETYRMIYSEEGKSFRRKSDKRNASYRSNSGFALVDFIGGRELGNQVTKAKKDKFTSAMEALLVDENGNLSVQSTHSDQPKLVWMTGQVASEKIVSDSDGDGESGGAKGK